MPPTRANGKVCYIQIPTDDIARSAEFYKRVLGWNVRKRNDGSIAFDDGVGEVSGEWVLRRKPAPAGLFVYIMVDSITESLNQIQAAGGTVLTPRTDIGPSMGAFGAFADPVGNEFGLYEEPQL